ncbi:uncharacterized protein LOC133328855 [Musca vetustissima]|uniref:uncharacterized protein LOC133328855 n=1 Tax=Musca vetustissima TaxID=27455 RepID=UPI002AB6FC8C|nr:uncharacterized protein LOC133328855 [Musca vetustissima]
MFRFIHQTHPRYRSQNSFTSTVITSEEIGKVKRRLAIIAQKVYYPSEYKTLIDKRPVSSSSSLLSLNPVLDEFGVMRLNGRLVKSDTLTLAEKYPIILPYSCRFTRLLVEYVHAKSVHGGNQLMLRLIRMEYWIPRVKVLIRTAISRCKVCLLEMHRPCNQIMGALPPERTSVTRAFTNTGVDFAGPFDIKSFTGRACRITKGYVCVFVCFATKAVHLEAASDLSSATFLATFYRFIGRRGCPKTIFSDNGTNFVGASRELENEFRKFIHESRDKVCSTLGFQELTWQFIPAGAPHMGGLWEAAVKSFKKHFYRHAKPLSYTFEEFSTILTRIEACLNSRPLCPMTDDTNDLVALTPGHFLIGAPLLSPPEPLIEELPLSLINRYRKLKALTHQFCLRWKEEYLVSLHKRYKWKYPQRNFEIDDLVVIRHENLPPTSWKLGRVVQTYPGIDGKVRVVDVKTAQGTVRRPVVKLVVLHN